MTNYDRLKVEIANIFNKYGLNEKKNRLLEKLVLFMVFNDQIEGNLLIQSMSPSQHDNYFYLSFQNLSPCLRQNIIQYFECLNIPTNIQYDEKTDITQYGLVTTKFIDIFLPLVKQALPHYLELPADGYGRRILLSPPGTAEDYQFRILKAIKDIKELIDSNNLPYVLKFINWTMDKLGIRENPNLDIVMNKLRKTIDHPHATAELMTSQLNLIDCSRYHPEYLNDRKLIGLMRNLRQYQMAFFPADISYLPITNDIQGEKTLASKNLMCLEKR